MRMSEPLTSTAFGALVLVGGAEHGALRHAAQVLERVEHGLRRLFREGRKAAADRVEQQQLGLVGSGGRNVLRALRLDPIGELFDCAWSLRLDGFCHGFLLNW